MESNKNYIENIQNISILLKNFFTYIPVGLSTIITKMPKLELEKEIIKTIHEQGLYRCETDEDIANTIIESEHIKASKRTTNYSLKNWVCLFAGTPSIDNYVKNIVNEKSSINPYVNPSIVVNAIKFTPTDDNLSNYRCRSLNDDVILYQGTCILPKGAAKSVKLVPDLIRDNNGAPIKNKKDEYDIKFREATEDELIPNTNTYLAKPDYLDYMKIQAQKRFYFQNSKQNTEENILKRILDIEANSKNAWNSIASMLHEADIEEKMIYSKNRFVTLKNSLKSFFSPKMTQLNPTIDECLLSYDLTKRNPYLDKTFALKLINMQKEQGINELKLKNVLNEFSNSDICKFCYQKNKILDNIIQNSSNLQAKNSDRIMLMSMIIAQKEGIFEDENTKSKIMEILYSASKLQNVKNKIELQNINGKNFSPEDKNITLALIEYNKSKRKNIDDIMKKYNIVNTQESEQFKKLSSILADAKALDNIKLDKKSPFGYKVHLNPDTLQNKASKSMIMLSYELFDLNKNINMSSILSYKNKNTEKNETKNKFIDILRENVRDESYLNDKEILRRKE